MLSRTQIVFVGIWLSFLMIQLNRFYLRLGGNNGRDKRSMASFGLLPKMGLFGGCLILCLVGLFVS
jgi:hypothetical protein